jgi:hypothetical protein
MGRHYVFTSPIMICHDQEPVDLDFYSNDILKVCVDRWEKTQGTNVSAPTDVVNFFKDRLNFGQLIGADINMYDYIILLHSELNSQQIEKCQKWYVPVYYWSHALIARDWFRYAAMDPVLTVPKSYTHDFLIYNRAWTGTREYRLKFSEMIAKSQLHQSCKMGFSTHDGEIYYTDHKFKNQNFFINDNKLQDYFFDNQTSSSASADYNNDDYQSCAIEVVLETLFDDTRIHLTEKTLRPIACGHPFILASTPGSLEYLRSYGFQTFEGLINEEYDLINDPVERLTAIIKIMKTVTNMPSGDKFALFEKMKVIARYNQERFFSDDFQNQVIRELKTNLDTGMKKMYQNRTGKIFREKIKFSAASGRRIWPKMISRQECVELWKWIHKHN